MSAGGFDPSSGSFVIELPADLDPFAAFRLAASSPWTLFLDSAERSSPLLGRYSYLAIDPFEVIAGRVEGWEHLALPHEPSGRARRLSRGSGDPFPTLARRLAELERPRSPTLPPFRGGAAGLFGYGLSRALERLPLARHDEFRIPDIAVGLYDAVVAFDHVERRALVISTGAPELDEAPRRQRAEARARELAAALGDAASTSPLRARRARGADADTNAPPPLREADLAPLWPVPGAPGIASDFSPEAYREAVALGIEAIRAGDIFQVNLSQRLLARAPSSPVEFYERLRLRNPAPFAGYFAAPGAVIASSSPEQFLTVTDGEVMTRPIKGTRRRGRTPEEDLFRRADLDASAKDRAENVMIVDLLRNDLSRVCRPGTVEVPRLFELERHPTVHHLVSEVRGRLREGRTAVDLLRASFPGGSITGAPKVRAMEIIAELEPTARGAYCGSLGWIGFDGDMSTSILIRTTTIARGWIQLPAGGGIVADSHPSHEHHETLHKAAGMLRALDAGS